MSRIRSFQNSMTRMYQTIYADLSRIRIVACAICRFIKLMWLRYCHLLISEINFFYNISLQLLILFTLILYYTF